jgi:hypothetical protein
MNDGDEEVVPGLTVAELTDIMEKIYARTDGSPPPMNDSEDGFLDILQNYKPSSAVAPAFVRKIVL